MPAILEFPVGPGMASGGSACRSLALGSPQGPAPVIELSEVDRGPLSKAYVTDLFGLGISGFGGPINVVEGGAGTHGHRQWVARGKGVRRHCAPQESWFARPAPHNIVVPLRWP